MCLNSHIWELVKVGFELRDPEGFGGKYQAILLHAIQRIPVLCLS